MEPACVFNLRSRLQTIKMVDIVVLPTLYVCAIVFGCFLGNCGRNNHIQNLNQQIDDLEWDLSITRRKLEAANDKLHAKSEST